MQMALAMMFGICAMGAAVAGVTLLVSQYVLEGRTWLAALIVALVLGAGAMLFARRGQHMLSPAMLLPNDTTTSIKETASWLKHPTTSGANSR